MSDRDGTGSVGDAPPHRDAWADSRVLEGVCRREPAALEQFFDSAFPYVYNLAHHLTGHEEAAEDATQEVFLKVYRAADRIDIHRNPRPWLTAITYNAVRDVARRSMARREKATDPAMIGAHPGKRSGAKDGLGRSEVTSLIERALQELADDQRAVVVLHDYDGVSHAVIADIMGLSHAAVRKRYSRALKQMKESIERLEE